MDKIEQQRISYIQRFERDIRSLDVETLEKMSFLVWMELCERRVENDE